jgi:hypothetical protein
MDYKEYADNLIKEWSLCVDARPRHDAVNIKIEKDQCEEWIIHLMRVRLWGTENELSEACYQVDWRLKTLKEKIIIEVLQNGAV